jgi:hypothetical protein
MKRFPISPIEKHRKFEQYKRRNIDIKFVTIPNSSGDNAKLAAISELGIVFCETENEGINRTQYWDWNKNVLNLNSKA